MIIHSIKATHTNEMEKAMHQSHGVGYAEYCRNLEKRLEVEKARDAEYKASHRLVATASGN